MCRFSLAELSGLAVPALALPLLLLAGCASTKVQSEWTDPQFAGRSLRGEKVLVICDAKEIAIKRNCEDQIGAQVAVLGATPVIAPASDSLAAGAGSADERTLAAARALGARAIFASTIAPDATVVSPGPSIGFGIGGFGGSGGWGGGSSVGGGVGVSMPVGSAAVSTAYGANMVITDAATGQMIWTGKVTTPASQNVTAQISQLARVGGEAAKKAGVF